MRRVAILIALSLAIGGLTFVVVRKLQVQAQVASRKPFTALMAERYYNSSGALVESYTSIYAIRSDGSSARIWLREDPNGRRAVIKGIEDLASKKRVAVDSMIESITTWPLSDEQVAGLKTADLSCAQAAEGERTTVLGYDVVKIQEELQAPSGKLHRDEFWRAPALDCFPMRERLSGGPSGGPVTLSTEREVVYVIPGEPAPALFEIPAGYTEHSPSQAAAEFSRRFLGGRKIMSEEQLRLRDEIYERHQKNR